MPDECRDEIRAAERAGDRYYRAITGWLTRHDRTDEQRQKAFVLARIYYRALDGVRYCLERIRNRPAAKQRLTYTKELQHRLEDDLRALGPNGLDSQVDET